MTVFITKYALFKGILELEAIEIEGDYFVEPPPGLSQVYYPAKKEVWLTLEEAQKRAEEMRLRQITFYENKIKLLKKKKFLVK